MNDDATAVVEVSPQEVKVSKPETNRGNLKIFLGYCAGVGKTYRMLQEAIGNKISNEDIVIGLVETHGRKETQELVSKLEVMPRKTIEYAGLTVNEMDLDAILARHPKLVLVDELAHTNIPGSRHAKRYQDVEELLNAGIDVYSTLNIQHVQSVTDIIHDITGIKVEEIIPDRILEIANEIELVDLPIEKLLQRLSEGKVYIPQKAKLAMQKFFKKGNLLALRELSLKYTAKRVDIDLLSYREKEDISTIWPVESKLLVGVSASKSTEKLLLIAHRMASDLEVEWYAVHVESPQQLKLDDKARNQLYRNIRLAEELGAKVVSLSGNFIADEMMSFAKQKNVTLIIVGLSHRSHFEEMFKGSVLSSLVKQSKSINVLVVGDEETKKAATQSQPKRATNLRQYLYSFIAIAVIAFLGRFFLHDYVTPIDLLMLMLMPVLAVSILWGSFISLFSSLFAIALIDFFFVPPIHSFAITDLRFSKSFLIFVLVALTISFLGRFIRWRAKSARYRERFVSALYSFSREIMEAESLDDILYRAVKNISEAFETDVIILLPDKSGALEFITKNREDLKLNETEKAVAEWSYKNGQHAGRGTNTLSSAKWYYIPLKLHEAVQGVICVMKVDIDKHFTPEQRRLLESFASVVALALTKLGNK